MSAIHSTTAGMTPLTLAIAIQFNNAGAFRFRSDPRKAWELFKGALEVKLAIERHMKDSRNCIVKDPFYEHLYAENSYVSRAQTILEEGETEVSPGGVADEITLEVVETTRALASSILQKQLSDELGDIFYTPFIFSKPFLVPEDCKLKTPIEVARTTSAIVIFNLALVEHMFNRTSPQAVSLYELSTSLLVGQVVNELSVALVNNIGVWCYENDDIDTAQSCMDHLSRILRNPSGRRLLSDGDYDSVMNNIGCMLMPRGTNSPAA